jgi:hypothetical protein
VVEDEWLRGLEGTEPLCFWANLLAGMGIRGVSADGYSAETNARIYPWDDCFLLGNERRQQWRNQ